MNDELNQILNVFYKRLLEYTLREKKKIENDSVLWTLSQMSNKSRKKVLNESSFKPNNFDIHQIKELRDQKYLKEEKNLFNENIYHLTAKGIWFVEKIKKEFNESDLISFFEKKYFSFPKERKPIDNQDKLAMLSLLGARNFSKESSMDLNDNRYCDNWIPIFKKAFKLLSKHQLLNNTDFDEIVKKKGSEHPISYLMRHRNDLPLKSNQVFKNPGRRTYWLDLFNENSISKRKLKLIISLIIGESNSYSLINDLKDFSNKIAYEKARYVKKNLDFLNSDVDDLIIECLNESYIGN